MKLLLLGAILIATPALGEQVTLKGLAPGLTLEEASRAIPGLSDHCLIIPKEKGGDGSRSCYYKPASRRANLPVLDTYAGTKVEAWFVRFQGEVISHISTTMDVRHHGRIILAMTEKWGKPFDETTTEVQNRMGSKFDQVVTTWKMGDSILVAKKRASRVDHMSVTLESAKLAKENARELMEDRPKQDAKDM